MIDGVMLAFETFVEAQWTQISRLYVGEKAQRYNWKQMMDLAESGTSALLPPFAVIEYEEEQEEDFGTCVDSYSMVANAYFVTSTSDVDGIEKSLDELNAELGSRASALKAAILDAQNADFTCTSAKANISVETNPANEYLVAQNHPFYTVMVTCTLLYGEES